MSKQENSFQTASGIPIKSVYTVRDTAAISTEKDLGAPGEYPFTRGTYPGGYRDTTWIMRVLCGESTPAETNKRLKLLTSAGQSALDIVGDVPTMTYLDSDHPMAVASVGTQGVPLCTLQDYLELFDGIPIGKSSVSFSVPHPFAIAGLASVARETGVSTTLLRGSTVNDPLYCEECSYVRRQPIEMRLRVATDSIEFAVKQMPNFHPFLEDTYYISEVGLTAVEEIALGLVEVRLLANEALKRGLGIDDFAPGIAMLVAVGSDFLEEVAKIRALRRIWSRMMKEEYKAKDPRSLKATIAVHTSGLSLTAKGMVNNVTRGAYQALAATMAGCRAVEISCFDEPIRTPSIEAAVVSLRTQQVIAYETGITKVADPLGGSYFVETLTNELDKRIIEMVRDIESQGDVRELSRRGYFSAIFENASKRYAEDVTLARKKIVRINTFPEPSQEDALLKESAEKKVEVSQEQIQKVKEIKAGRSKTKVSEALNEVYESAQKRSVNLIPVIMKALKEGLTMAEITGVIRVSYGANFDQFDLVPKPSWGQK